jgi:hypothetical protein
MIECVRHASENVGRTLPGAGTTQEGLPDFFRVTSTGVWIAETETGKRARTATNLRMYADEYPH